MLLETSICVQCRDSNLVEFGLYRGGVNALIVEELLNEFSYDSVL